MKSKILKIVLRIIFGEYALSGFYDEEADKETKPTEYVFGSVFPDRETMDIALKRYKN